MELIFHRGLNCHQACLISLAQALGLRHTDAYAALWSEMEFKDDLQYGIYTSKRILVQLAALGLQMDLLPDIRPWESLAHFPDGQAFVAEMDSYALPWHPVYGHIHDYHYMFFQKQRDGQALCYDPVFQIQGQVLALEALLSGTYELCHVQRVMACAPVPSPAQEARAFLALLPGLQDSLFAQLLACKGEGNPRLAALIKQFNAMINNRYLYGRHLHRFPGHDAYFGDGFFAQWESFRNGLYMASIVKDNRSRIEELCGLLLALLEEEQATATGILALENPKT